jgi:hypothetical protein
VAVDDWLADHDVPSRALDPVQVSDISSDDDEISFTVDEVGVPVVVRASYFPNWKVEGAEGPYRLTPNLMVVIPTDEEVRLHYGWVPIDIVSWLLTFVGIGALIVLVRRPAVTIPAGPVAEWHRPPTEPRADESPPDHLALFDGPEPDPPPSSPLDDRPPLELDDLAGAPPPDLSGGPDPSDETARVDSPDPDG